MKKLMHRFCDLPSGTKFKYKDGGKIWVVIENFGDGLVAGHIPVSEISEGCSLWQSLCSFVDEEFTLESKVEVFE